MNLTDEQVRQVRVWAVETTLGLVSINKGTASISEVVADAAILVSFVLTDQPASPRK